MLLISPSMLVTRLRRTATLMPIGFLLTSVPEKVQICLMFKWSLWSEYSCRTLMVLFRAQSRLTVAQYEGRDVLNGITLAIGPYIKGGRHLLVIYMLDPSGRSMCVATLLT